jgi:hypothetical protein
METGVGAARTERAVKWLFDKPQLGVVPYRPQLVISAGFAGSLHPDRRAGDIILANEVVDADGHSWRTTWPEKLPEGEWQPPLHRGRLLTIGQIVATPEAKRLLAENHEAVAVDMESAMVARWCADRSVPFTCMRAISDDFDTPLSRSLADLLRDGRVDALRLVGSVLIRPWIIGELWRLARQTTYAGQQLGKALGELLTLTTPYCEE